MDIDITLFFKQEDAAEYSGSVAERGPNAGAITWRASQEAAGRFRMLDTPDKLDAFRTWLKPWGGWSEAEIAAMSDDDLNALFLQWVASDMREGGLNDLYPNWAAYEEKVNAGQCHGTIFRNGEKVFFSLDH
jgi:hypothetical protein